MSVVLLISLDTLKKEYLIDDNLDDKYIISNIKKGQDFRLATLIEDTQWNEILLQASTNTLTVKNEYIVKHFLQPILAYFVMSEVIFTTAYKFKNAGMGGSEDQPNANRFKELIEISNKYKKDSEHYEMLFKEYIRETGDVQVDNTYVFKSNIYLGQNDIYDKGYHTIAHKNNRKGFSL